MEFTILLTSASFDFRGLRAPGELKDKVFSSLTASKESQAHIQKGSVVALLRAPREAGHPRVTDAHPRAARSPNAR